MHKLFALLALLIAPALHAQSHTPLKNVAVTLQSVPRTDKSTFATITNKPEAIVVHATTDERGKFMFGYVPPGVYALGCSYSECRNAFGKCEAQNSDKDPAVQISVNACEGMVCHVSSGKMTNDDWATCSIKSAETTIHKDWSNTADWLQMGGGVMLKIDAAHAVVSGKIEAQ